MISVIITTKNEEKNIENCLKSILNQTYLSQRQNLTSGDSRDKIEIIVVDNNSTDRTKEIARKYTDKVFNLGLERSAQRDFGAKPKKRKSLSWHVSRFKKRNN